MSEVPIFAAPHTAGQRHAASRYYRITLPLSTLERQGRIRLVVPAGVADVPTSQARVLVTQRTQDEETLAVLQDVQAGGMVVVDDEDDNIPALAEEVGKPQVGAVNRAAAETAFEKYGLSGGMSTDSVMLDISLDGAAWWAHIRA